MEFLATLIPKLASIILSWLDAGNLRNKVYDLHEKVELSKVAFDDIIRMSDNQLVKDIAKKTLKIL